MTPYLLRQFHAAYYEGKHELHSMNNRLERVQVVSRDTNTE
jgi:hypothetical protein